ncbi:MAG: PadR family transcriptional regulator, partial [Brevundimonas sp.]
MDAQVKSQPQAYDTPEYWAGLIKMSLSKFFVLCALKNRPMHGYEISRSVSDLTGGCCAPTPGSLYPLLREFEQGGYVTCREETGQGPPRKVYTLTERGERA